MNKSDFQFDVFVDESADGSALQPKFSAIVFNEEDPDTADMHLSDELGFDYDVFDEIMEATFTLPQYSFDTKEEFMTKFAKLSGIAFSGVYEDLCGDDIESEPCHEVEPEGGKIVMVDATPESIAKQIISHYKEQFPQTFKEEN